MASRTDSRAASRTASGTASTSERNEAMSPAGLDGCASPRAARSPALVPVRLKKPAPASTTARAPREMAPRKDDWLVDPEGMLASASLHRLSRASESFGNCLTSLRADEYLDEPARARNAGLARFF